MYFATNFPLFTAATRPFDFLLDNQLLRSDLRTYLETRGLSAESELLLEVGSMLPFPTALLIAFEFNCRCLKLFINQHLNPTPLIPTGFLR